MTTARDEGWCSSVPGAVMVFKSLAGKAKLLAAVALLALGSTIAAAQDTTASLSRRSWLPFSGLHVSVGGGAVPYLEGSTGGAEEYKVMLTLRRFPEWSVGSLRSVVGGTDTTGYVATYPSGLPTFAKPWMLSEATGIRAERRWAKRRRFHGMLALSAGAVFNAHEYYRYENGVRVTYQEHESTHPFGEIGGGGELNIAQWLRVNVVLGLRVSSKMTAPVARGSNTGFTSTINLAVGKF